MRAVSFDLGQTLVELDTAFLAERCREQGWSLLPQSLDLASEVAWEAYALAKRQGQVGEAAWSAFMRTLLQGAGARRSAPSQTGDISPDPCDAVGELVRYLWQQQPVQNLWRRPIAGMFELASELGACGVRTAILTNSEGRALELVTALGWADTFPIVVDSGLLGMEKPEPAIFSLLCARLGVPAAGVVHVGDSVEADVLGAQASGLQAIGFGSPSAPLAAAGTPWATDAAELREVLCKLGLPLNPKSEQRGLGSDREGKLSSR